MEYCTDDHFYDDNGGGCGWEPKDSIENTRHILRTMGGGRREGAAPGTMQTDLVELWHQIESATPFGSWEKQRAKCKDYWYGTDRLVGDLKFHFGCLCEPL